MGRKRKNCGGETSNLCTPRRKVKEKEEEKQDIKTVSLSDEGDVYCGVRMDFGGVTIFASPVNNNYSKFPVETSSPDTPLIPKYQNVPTTPEWRKLLAKEKKEKEEKRRKSVCWLCTFSFSGFSVKVPLSEKNGLYRCMGTFCSWECGKRHLMESPDAGRKYLYIDLLNQMIRKAYGNNIKIQPSPPRNQLKKFGGTKEIKDFRNFNCLSQI